MHRNFRLPVHNFYPKDIYVYMYTTSSWINKTLILFRLTNYIYIKLNIETRIILLNKTEKKVIAKNKVFPN